MHTAKFGDHPLTDMLEYDVECFGPEVDGLVRIMAKHRNYEAFRADVSRIFWDYAPTGDGGALQGGTAKAHELLLEVNERMQKKRRWF